MKFKQNQLRGYKENIRLIKNLLKIIQANIQR